VSQYTPPGELLEGYTRSVDDNPLARFFGRRDAAFSPPDRLEVDLEDPTAFDRQMYDQVRCTTRRYVQPGEMYSQVSL
jgi:hypothetical protein